MYPIFGRVNHGRYESFEEIMQDAEPRRTPRTKSREIGIVVYSANMFTSMGNLRIDFDLLL